MDDPFEQAVFERLLQSEERHTSLREHRLQILRQVAARWGFAEDTLHLPPPDPTAEIRRALATFLGHEREPTSLQGWNKALTTWLKRYRNPAKDITLFRLLAVDGFDGFDAHRLSDALPNVTLEGYHPATVSHVCAVRKVYHYMEEHPLLSSLMGPEAAQVVHWTVLRTYAKRVPLHDDKVASTLDRAIRCIQERLYAHVETYPDIRSVTPELVDTLGDVYASACADALETIARFKLASL